MCCLANVNIHAYVCTYDFYLSERETDMTYLPPSLIKWQAKKVHKINSE